MKKTIALVGSILLALGLKAQTTHKAKKETAPMTATQDVTAKPMFVKAGSPLQNQKAATSVQKKVVAKGAAPSYKAPASRGKHR